MLYNKISVVMDQFNLFEIPKIFPQKKKKERKKNPYILRKLDPF